MFIRDFKDIETLKDYEYGVPRVTNFPLVDFVIKLPDYCIVGHAAAGTIQESDKVVHQDIEKAVGQACKKIVMVFCVDRSNFDRFAHVPGLVEEVRQYKLLAEWSGLRKRAAGDRGGLNAPRNDGWKLFF